MKGFNRTAFTLVVLSLVVPMMAGCSGGGGDDKAGVDKGDVIGKKPADAKPRPVGNTRIPKGATGEDADKATN